MPPTDATTPQQPRSPPPWRRWALGGLAVLVLLAVFALYTQPDFMVMLADQMWACF